ncbi:MAG: flagellar export chaperone FlgN [Thermoguttaceae bacterium]
MTHWETEISAFLSELSLLQEETLYLLKQKGDLLAQSKTEEIEAMKEHESQVLAKMTLLLQQREKMLQIAKAENLPHDSIESLAQRIDLESPENNRLGEKCRQSVHQARLLQHQSLTNWVLTQRSLIHVAQVLEMISSRGKPRGTYNRRQNKESHSIGGTLLDLMSEK